MPGIDLREPHFSGWLVHGCRGERLRRKQGRQAKRQLGRRPRGGRRVEWGEERKYGCRMAIAGWERWGAEDGRYCEAVALTASKQRRGMSQGGRVLWSLDSRGVGWTEWKQVRGHHPGR